MLSRSIMAALGNSSSSQVGMSELRIPTGIGRVLHHVPAEIRRAVGPPHRAALTQRPLGLVYGPARIGFRLAVERLSGAAYRPSGHHQLVNETGSPGFIERGSAMRHSLPRTTK